MADEKIEVESDFYIYFGSQSDTIVPNKTRFIGLVNLEVVIVQRSKTVIDKSPVEAAANQILQIIFPTPGTFGVSLNDPYSLTYVKFSSGQTLAQETDKGFIQTKTITFTNRITQN